MSQPEELTEKNVIKWLDETDTFLLDCDGVIWKGEESISGVAESLQLLRALGKKVLFISNNSTKTRASLLPRFQARGLGVALDEVYTSAYAAASYLQSQGFTKAVYVVGEEGLATELRGAGLSVRGVREHAQIPSGLGEVYPLLELDPSIGAVVCGLDSALTYPKLAYASYQLRYNPDCLFIATNTDTTYPSPSGLVPGGGTMVAMLQAGSGRTPLVMGKPHALLLDLIKTSFHLTPSRTVMIGDRLDTDIAFGLGGGLKTLLVLTGVSQREDLQHPHLLPHHVLPSLGDLVPLYLKAGGELS